MRPITAKLKPWKWFFLMSSYRFTLFQTQDEDKSREQKHKTTLTIITVLKKGMIIFVLSIPKIMSGTALASPALQVTGPYKFLLLRST